MSELNRREFVVLAGAVCAGVCMMGSDALAQSGSSAGLVDIGLPSDFPKGQISPKFAKTNGIIVAHIEGRIIAMTSRCTHKGSQLGVKNNQIKCPSHGSSFSEQGTPSGGPAKAALFRFAISKNEQGHLIVDKSRQFGERQWEEPGAFYAVT